MKKINKKNHFCSLFYNTIGITKQPQIIIINNTIQHNF